MPPSRSTTPRERTITPPTTMTFTLTFTLTLLCVACTWHAARGQTANTLDETSNTITWGELAPDAPYKEVGDTAGALGPYFDLATSFVDSSLPAELPIDTVKGIIDGDTTIQDEWQALAKSFVGFFLCLVIGLLFVFIFPIVAICFCCCRCCGNCGGKRIQKEQEKGSCKRNVFAAILVVLALFVITGSACTFASSDQLSKNLNTINDTFAVAMDNFKTFTVNIKAQFTRLGDTNFKFLKTTVDTYVTGASDEVSDRIAEDVNKLVGLDEPLDKLSALSATVKVKVAVLNDQVSLLKTQQTSALSQLTTFDAACTCLATEKTKMQGFDIATLESKIQTLETTASEDVFAKMRSDISGKIQTEVDKGTSGLDVNKKMDEIYDQQIKGMLDQTDNLKDNVDENADKYQEQVEDYSDTGGTYDKYRWYAGLGLALIPMFIAFMVLLGVALGFCCGSAQTPPTERGTGSNCGGICLMAAVGFIFIFSAFLMLLTTLMYVFGSLSERYICQSFEHLERVEKYTQSFDLGMDLSDMSFDINGQQISTSVSKVMSGCKEGKTLYEVLGLSVVVDTALKEITDYKQDLNIANNGMSMTSAANDLQSVSLNLNNEISSLQQSSTELGNVEAQIDTLRNQLTTDKGTASGHDPEYGKPYDPMITTLDAMKTTTGELKTTTDDIVAEANGLGTKITDAESKLKNQTEMEKIIKGATDGFVATIFGFVDSYVNDIKAKLEKDVAKCTPVYTVSNAIIDGVFCGGIIEPLNGFWLGLGWCIFFMMPTLIFSVKLAKYYRRMLYSDTYDSTLDSKPPPYYIAEGSAPPAHHRMPNNKVAPF